MRKRALNFSTRGLYGRLCAARCTVHDLSVAYVALLTFLANHHEVRPLSPVSLALDALMTAFTYASYAGPGLPRGTAEALSRPAGRRGRYAPGSAYRSVHDSRGMRRVGGEHGPALRLLQTYAALGAPAGSLLALRDALVESGGVFSTKGSVSLQVDPEGTEC